VVSGSLLVCAYRPEYHIEPTAIVKEAAVQCSGVFSVLPTPFKAKGELDLVSLRRVIDLFVSAGVDGVTALGVTSEVSRLSERERVLVIETVVAHVNGRVPVIASATADGLNLCLEYSRAVRLAGASAIMISPPRMAKLNSEAVFRHFSEVASALDLPIVVQDYPPISGYPIEAALLARIAREIPAARTIKLEDPPTPVKTASILANSQGVSVQILGGLGGAFLLEELMAGAAGVMTGFAVPEVLVKVVRLFKSGQLSAASDLFYTYVPLIRFESQEGIGLAIRKELLHRRGAIQDPHVRAPGAGLDAGSRSALDHLLNWPRLKQELRWN
jgi:4-hydroxy-tetrahydrodipicolinate synthase